jgi:hypothetical protein
VIVAASRAAIDHAAPPAPSNKPPLNDGLKLSSFTHLLFLLARMRAFFVL